MDVLKIDTREESELSKLVEDYCRDMNIPHEIEWVDIGDYTFADVCFEA